jgi:hypothetical protein
MANKKPVQPVKKPTVAAKKLVVANKSNTSLFVAAENHFIKNEKA